MEFYQKVALRTAKEMVKMLLFLSIIFGGLFVFVWGGSFLGLSSGLSQAVFALVFVTWMMGSFVAAQIRVEIKREERERAREKTVEPIG
jgi:membrane associated rhomboid family serine protease